MESTEEIERQLGLIHDRDTPTKSGARVPEGSFRSNIPINNKVVWSGGKTKNAGKKYCSSFFFPLTISWFGSSYFSIFFCLQPTNKKKKKVAPKRTHQRHIDETLILDFGFEGIFTRSQRKKQEPIAKRTRQQTKNLR